MKGYRCDRCEQWFEKGPRNRASDQYIPEGHLVKRMIVDLHAYPSASTSAFDLCEECTVAYLELFCRTYRQTPHKIEGG